MIKQLTELTQCYLEPHRTFHNLDHIKSIFEMAREYDLTLTAEQHIAIWYHDAIYNTQSTSNEEMSALLMRNHLEELKQSEHSIRTIETIIIDTKKHFATSQPSMLVIDLDLAWMGLPFSQYDENVGKIRQEYKHLSVEQWNEGRRKFLQELLFRDTIFVTDWGKSHFEHRTRSNISIELKWEGFK